MVFKISHQSIILSADKVWGYGIGLLLFHEQLNFLSIFGSSEIWLSILILALYNEHEIKDADESTSLRMPGYAIGRYGLESEDDTVDTIRFDTRT